MKLSQFKFKLPEEQIALYPHSIWHEFKNEQGENETFRITRRDECRLMVLHRKSQTIDMYKRDENGNPIEGEFLDFRNVLHIRNGLVVRSFRFAPHGKGE